MMYEQERRLIVDTCKYLQSIEFFLGTWGNVSIRRGNHILLTPSRVNYDIMTPGDIVIIDMDENKIEGDRNPTSEKEVHRQIYRVRDDLGAIIHAHTVYAMAASTMAIESVPCIVEEMSQLLGGSIPLAKLYVPAAQHAQLGLAAAEVIGDRSGVILRNHGPVSCGRNMEEAILVAKVIEKACKIFLEARGPLCAIPEQYAQSERYRYLYTYGKEKT